MILSLSLSPIHTDLFMDSLALYASEIVETEPGTLLLYGIESEIDIAHIEQTIERLAQFLAIPLPDLVPWQEELVEAENKSDFAYNQADGIDITLGSVHICSPDMAAQHKNQGTTLIIDPKHSFGAGSHATTRQCLEMLYNLHQHAFAPSHILDCGTGSAILALYACCLFPNAAIIAFDNDPNAIVASSHNIAINKASIPTPPTLIHTDKLSDTALISHAPYDLIIANLLLNIHMSFAADYAKLLAKDGVLICSGLLPNQGDNLVEHLAPLGLQPQHTITEDGWSTVCVKKLSTKAH